MTGDFIVAGDTYSTPATQAGTELYDGNVLDFHRGNEDHMAYNELAARKDTAEIYNAIPAAAEEDAKPEVELLYVGTELHDARRKFTLERKIV